MFVPSVDEIISLVELEGLGARTDLLGRGNFGEVYKVWYRGREVAVKCCTVLKPLQQTRGSKREVDLDCVVGLNREVAMLRRMVGVPNVIDYLGVAQDDTSCYIVMEYAAGGSLETRLLRSTSGVERDHQPPPEFVDERHGKHPPTTT